MNNIVKTCAIVLISGLVILIFTSIFKRSSYIRNLFDKIASVFNDFIVPSSIDNDKPSL